MTSREQFEAWFAANLIGLDDADKEPCWEAWQASRAAVVVTGLSVDERELAIGDRAEFAMNYAIQRILVAGVKVAK